MSLPCVVDGVSGSDNILELWKKHDGSLLNCVQSDPFVVRDVDHFDVIQCHEVLKVISKRSENKATGADGVSAEHLKFAGARLAPATWTNLDLGLNPDLYLLPALCL